MQPTHITATAPRVLARDLASAEPGERASLAGWIHRRRVLASVTFLVLRDRSGLAQVVVKDRDTVEQLAGLPEETVVEVTGTVSANESAPGGAELVEPSITALTEPAMAPPAELWRPTFGAGLPTHLDHAAVTLRHPRHRAAWQIASASMRGFRSALGALEFTEIATPKLVGTATESGANVFSVDYFGRTAYLAQSPQLYKQMLVGVFERVFEVGRSSAPSPTTPCATSRSTRLSTPSSASSATTATCWRSCARPSPAWSRPSGSMPATPLRSWPSSCPGCPTSSPSSTSGTPS